MTSIRIRTHLPKTVGFKYKPNHHFVELEDSEGNVAHLPAHGVMAHGCGDCNMQWLTMTNMCSFCPSCGSSNVVRRWGALQVAFVPEKESSFIAPISNEAKDIGTDDIEVEGGEVDASED